MPSIRLRLLMLPLLLGVSGCEFLASLFCDQETDENCEDPKRAQVEGRITLPEANGAAAGFVPVETSGDAALSSIRSLVAKAAARPMEGRDPHARKRVPGRAPVEQRDWVKGGASFRPGEAIVRAHEPMRDRKAEYSAILSAFLFEAWGRPVVVEVRLCGTEFRCLADLRDVTGKPLPLEETAEAVTLLDGAPWLKFAERNLILQKTAIYPDDEFFSFQWHYMAIDVPSAWDVTVGDSSVVAAVIDTGILLNHPELADRVIASADLIDDPAVANDDDGRDDNGHDAGDNACGSGCHSHHGSHVAGTMAAATDNGSMVAGIAWEGSLLAVRVLGEGGGSLADIADGIEWAVGNSVDGVDDNGFPADVLNLSLGGSGESAALDEAVADAVATGAIVLVAAGNDDVDASEFTPANSPDAITIAAVGNGAGDTPRKASYSNFGSMIDVAGPGGEQREDNDDDGNGDGVLSTVGDFVAFYQGTSMATPHVAGVAMLMKSIDRTLDQDEARAILRDTADADIQCAQGCGAGLINAYAAVRAATGDELTGLSGTSVRVGRGVTEAKVTFRNFGAAAVDVEFAAGGANRDAITVAPPSGSIPGGGKLVITVTIARNDARNDTGSATITAVAGAETAEARVDWTPDASSAAETVSVGAVRITGDPELPFRVTRIVETNRLKNLEYKLFNLDPGTYLIIGIVDANGNGSFDDPEDGTGIYVPSTPEGSACPTLGCGHIVLEAGDHGTGADFLVAPGFTGGTNPGGGGDNALGGSCASSSDCGDGLYCEAAFADFGGYCTTDCNGGADECPAGATCFDIGATDPYQICFKDCDVDTDCDRAGYVCAVDNVCEPAG